MNDKFYRQIKIFGLLMFVPFILGAGPLLGYFAGDFLERKLSLPHFVSLAAIAVGFVGSIVEIVKIVRLVMKIEKMP